jgi:hypothetical protein
MANRNFKYVDDWASIRLVDSFVKENKAGTGNGEASLYLGSKYDPDIFEFFGEEAFDAHCTLLRDDILDYLADVKWEYTSHRFQYRNTVNLESWKKKVDEVRLLPDELYFNLTRKRMQDKNGRVYAQELSYKHGGLGLTLESNHKAYVYDLIRRIAIPEVSFLMLTKTGDWGEYLARLYYDPSNTDS